MFGIKPIKFADPFRSNSTSKKRKNISFTAKAILWEKDKRHICHICRQKIHSLTEAQVDHVRAHSKGGKRISWAHSSCNRMKGSKSLSKVHRELGIKSNKKSRRKRKSKKPDEHGFMGTFKQPKIRLGW